MVKLPEPECRLGYTVGQIKDIFHHDLEALDKFERWMNGQTMGVCDGLEYDLEKKVFVRSACAVEHGIPIVYPHDLERYLAGLPVVD